MKVKFIIGFMVGLIFLFLFTSLSRGSYAKEEDKVLEIDLYKNIDDTVLMEDIKEFIDLVDGDIIVNSSFNLSSVLNENYDFLTKFVISFVLNNAEYFDIINGPDYEYIDDSGRVYTSNKYISVDLLYDIVYRIFGVEYYYILDEDLVVDDKIVLIDTEEKFNMEISDIVKVDKNFKYYDVYVKYDLYDGEYIYRFEVIDDNRLVINNLIIGD